MRMHQNLLSLLNISDDYIHLYPIRTLNWTPAKSFSIAPGQAENKNIERNYTEEVRSPNSDKDLTNRFSDSLIKLMRHHQHCITASLLGNTESLQQRMHKVLHEDIVFLQGLHVKGETHESQEPDSFQAWVNWDLWKLSGVLIW